MKRTVLAGFVVFGLSVLIAGMGPVFAGENESPVYGESQYGESINAGIFPHAKGKSQMVETDPAGFADHHIGEGGTSAEYWQAVGTGSLQEAKQASRLVDAGVDPARWAEPQAE